MTRNTFVEERDNRQWKKQAEESSRNTRGNLLHSPSARGVQQAMVILLSTKTLY